MSIYTIYIYYIYIYIYIILYISLPAVLDDPGDDDATRVGSSVPGVSGEGENSQQGVGVNGVPSVNTSASKYCLVLSQAIFTM